MPELELAACRSRPLAAYLKALGVLRLVAEQKAPEARGFWRDGVFVLSSPLDRDGLLAFFLDTYSPTPLVTPWNGGSGFYPGDNREGIDAIAASKDQRLDEYRKVIERIRDWPEFTGQGRESRTKDKNLLLQRCRSCLPNRCLPWLDAAFALGEDKAYFAPLLGTGGNEGHLEYSKNFMQRVALLFAGEPPQSRAAWLEAALFDTPACDMPGGAVGQFNPGNAGGVNQATTKKLEEKQPNNPWDFILMFEGTLIFAAALARRSPDTSGKISAPFSTPFSTPVLAAGFASAALQDKSRGEVWLPLWPRPASLRELRRLFGEGRASLNGKQARNGMDFARAAVTLGVDRGIDGFERYAFLERRGQGYYVALPGGRIPVTYRNEAELLNPAADYLEHIGRLPQKDMPETMLRATRLLTREVFACINEPNPQHFIAVSRALAGLDALPNLPKLVKSGPCRALQPGWIAACGDSPEARLAAALASLTGHGELGPMRAHLAPVNPQQPGAWDKNSGQYVAFRGGTRELLGRILLRRLMEAERLGADPWRARLVLDPADLLPLVHGEIDWPLLGDLLRAFSLVRFPRSGGAPWPKSLRKGRLPHALALMKLLYTSWPKNIRCELDPAKLRWEGRMAMLVRAGRVAEACGLVVGRLRVAGAQKLFLPATAETAVRGLQAPEILACLLVPVRLRTLLRKHLNLEVEQTQTEEPL